MQVLVRDNNVDQALKALKKKMQREGIFREMKLRGHYEKPSEKKARETHDVVAAVVHFDSTTRTIIDGRKFGCTRSRGVSSSDSKMMLLFQQREVW